MDVMRNTLENCLEGEIFAVQGLQLIVGALFDHQTELVGVQIWSQISPDARNTKSEPSLSCLSQLFWLSSSDGCTSSEHTGHNLGLGKKSA